jgi:hypothetical protein
MFKKTLLCSVLASAILLGTMSAAPAYALDRWLGSYVPGAPSSMSPLTTLESKLGARAPVVNYFTNVLSGLDTSLVSKVAAHGSTPLVTLGFWNPAKGVKQSTYTDKKIAGGSLDSYLRAYALKAKAYGATIWLRPFHEMNGNWYPWGGTVNGNTPSQFIAAWRHVKNIFTAEGATNVKFVWCPNTDSVPNTSANAISKYWPGSSYVDYVALDGYNWGGSQWKSFSAVFSHGYAAIKKLPTKPLIIAETGCATSGGNKAAWVAAMYKVIPTSYGRIIGISWFDANKEHDWRMDSSSAVMAAFRAGVQTF